MAKKTRLIFKVKVLINLPTELITSKIGFRILIQLAKLEGIIIWAETPSLSQKRTTMTQWNTTQTNMVQLFTGTIRLSESTTSQLSLTSYRSRRTHQTREVRWRTLLVLSEKIWKWRPWVFWATTSRWWRPWTRSSSDLVKKIELTFSSKKWQGRTIWLMTSKLNLPRPPLSNVLSESCK